jgi:hypothetical protein
MTDTFHLHEPVGAVEKRLKDSYEHEPINYIQHSRSVHLVRR